MVGRSGEPALPVNAQTRSTRRLHPHARASVSLAASRALIWEPSSNATGKTERLRQVLCGTVPPAHVPHESFARLSLTVQESCRPAPLQPSRLSSPLKNQQKWPSPRSAYPAGLNGGCTSSVWAGMSGRSVRRKGWIQKPGADGELHFCGLRPRQPHQPQPEQEGSP